MGATLPLPGCAGRAGPGRGRPERAPGPGEQSGMRGAVFALKLRWPGAGAMHTLRNTVRAGGRPRPLVGGGPLQLERVVLALRALLV